jgi:FtsP/CotA-like multicopper oxidase with cupredoxin domain
MKTTERAPDRVRRKRLRWLNFTLAALLGLGLGIGQGLAATGGVPGKPTNTEPTNTRPIQTKSGRRAAIQEAAQAVLEAQTLTTLAAPTALDAGTITTLGFPESPTDEAAVPHYFGPFPNWALSPLTWPDATVAISGNGTGATASATVGANGAVTGITITNPGSGYTTATVDITGAGTGASATAAVTASGVVTAVTVDLGGAGYTAPTVTLSGGCSPTPDCEATGTVYGGVDFVEVTNGGSGYTNPTVDFDMPDGPDGVKAVAHAVCDDVDDGTCGVGGVITAIIVDQPGSGYSFAPNVVIRNGTLYDPIPGGSGATASATLAVQTVVLETFGSNYTSDPTVVFADPTGDGASATATTDAGGVTSITLDAPGSGYITGGGMKKFVDTLPKLCDPSNITTPADPGDPTADPPIPAIPATTQCDDVANNLGQYLPLGVPDTTTFTTANGFADNADYYQIGLVQYRKQMSSSLPGQGTLVRGYVQLETPANAAWSKHIPLCNADLLDPTLCTAVLRDGAPVYAVDEPQWLGPVIAAEKERPVRITFFNLLPTGSGGDLYIPTDSSLMGSGFVPAAVRPLTDEGSVTDEVRNPPCTQSPKPSDCFKDARATLHLHGGLSPWISDGTPHQWITPAEDAATNPEPEGASVGEVPDMSDALAASLGVPDCSGENDGCQTFYYTNQQSARLMFYHDHAFGTTRLNVYLGEAAGYLIADETEKRLIDTGTIPAEQIPLIIQDRTFVPDLQQVAEQDPTWDYNRWGGYGDFWYHHVYMPAQNPGDPSGMSAYGRWMYGPWFWPPAAPPHGPIDNPYYDPSCNLDDPATWTYQTDPFCEPPMIPGTPNISAGMEQFNDTPLVNGTAYPTLTVEPKSYRLRVLNAANDRFMNLQLYPADPTTASTDTNADGQPIGGTEVALDPIELAAAQLDPVVFPTPVLGTKVIDGKEVVSTAGPDWIVIGSEGGFLPAPVVVDGQQPTTWITDPTVFNVGNVDKHSLLVAPAERADVIVDFSKFSGQTLILYNDAPAAFPARVPSYDYYTGAPDLYPVGAPTILPGYGPNTRTVMQIKVAATQADGTGPAPAFSLTKLRTAFSHKADGSGAYESGQHPVIVGQAAYNSAYGTSFAASGDCNSPPVSIDLEPDTTNTLCDGLLRINNQGGTWFGFNTLRTGTTAKLNVGIEPKGIHDEMNSADFDEFGRMTANMGLEVVPATPGLQNIVLYPFVNPATELLDGTKLPQYQIGLDIEPIATGDDGTQIWKITHNGVDTHPLHFHLYDVQLLNRVTWDNIVSPPHPTELGWKDTVRVSPLEDTIVALRPVVPELPWQLPNSVRPLNPAVPIGYQIGFNNIDAEGNPTDPITNQLVNFGWEYVWHCHILSHEEMDMMRPQSLALPPNAPAGLTAIKVGSGDTATVELSWSDVSIADTLSSLQVAGTATGPWMDLATYPEVLGGTNFTGERAYTDPAGAAADWNYYRVLAQNTVGYGGQFMAITPESSSDVVQVPPTPIAGVEPTSLVFGSQEFGTTSAAQTVTLSNSGRAPLSISSIVASVPFVVQTNTCGGTLAAAAGPGAPSTCTISVTFTPNAVALITGSLVIITDDPVQATLTVDLTGTGTVLNTPTGLSGTAVRTGSTENVTLTWTDNSLGETGFSIQRAQVNNRNQCTADAAFTTLATVVQALPGTGLVTATDNGIPRAPYCYRVRANAADATANSAWSTPAFVARP